jgi:hypothetical protein
VSDDGQYRLKAGPDEACHPILCRMPLIMRLIIQTIRRDPSGSDQIDEAPNVSRPDPSGPDQIDADHQATDLAGGFESLAVRQKGRWSRTAALVPHGHISHQLSNQLSHHLMSWIPRHEQTSWSEQWRAAGQVADWCP